MPMSKVPLHILASIGFKSVVNRFLKMYSVTTHKNCMLPPSYVNMRVTRRCNLQCKQCTYWKMKPEKELSTEEWKGIILDIKKNVGYFFARFYGGEVFCRQDLLELISFCYEEGIYSCITTNGTMITDEVAKHFHAKKVLLVAISLDGASAHTHNELRGIPGTFERIMQSIDFLQGRVPVQINSTIMRENIQEIIPLAEFAQQLRCPISFQGVSVDVYKNNDAASDNTLWPDKSSVDHVIDELIHMKKTNAFIMNDVGHLERLRVYFKTPELLRRRHCEGLGRQLMVKNDGKVVLCSYGSLPVGAIGDLSEQSFSDMWHSSYAQEKRDRMIFCSEKSCMAIRGCYQETVSEKFRKFMRYVYN